MYVSVHMKSNQFSGELWLPAARDDTVRRYVSVDFTCPIELASVSTLMLFQLFNGLLTNTLSYLMWHQIFRSVQRIL